MRLKNRPGLAAAVVVATATFICLGTVILEPENVDWSRAQRVAWMFAVLCWSWSCWSVACEYGRQEAERKAAAQLKAQVPMAGPGMTQARYKQLSRDLDLNLTQEEIDAGWFFHNGFDGLLVHKTWPEAEVD